MLFSQFVFLLAVHWVADFVAQTHWQASNKSKSNVALLRHVGVYTSILYVGSFFIFWGKDWLLISMCFAIGNGALHFCTDYFTSRLSSKLFGAAFRDSLMCSKWGETYGRPPTPDEMRRLDVDPDANHWHNFFVVIGADQLVHQVTLAGTLWIAHMGL